jgi:hypothetical protein
MHRRGYSEEQIMGVLMNPANAVHAHIGDHRDPRYQALRCIEGTRGEPSPIQLGKPLEPAAGGGGLPFEWAGAIEPQLVGFWLIKRLLPAQGMALIYGHPGSGKTFLAFDFAAHVALGWEWNGRKVKQGLVVYVAAEGVNGLKNRVAAFRKHHGIGPDTPFPLAIIGTPIDMQAAGADTARLAETIRAACQECGFDPALIIIDTISKTFGAGKENTDDMGTYVANCQRISSEFECCVMPVHHRPKDAESEDPRGHSSLRGGIDTMIIVEAGKPKKARVRKQRDGEEGETFLFDLVPVELGLDEDGEPVTSCFVEPAMVDTNPAPDPRISAAAKLTDGQKLTLHWLKEAVAQHGHAVPGDIPDNAINRLRVGKVVPIDAWRTLYFAATGTGPGQVGDEAPGQVRDKERDNQRRIFNRNRDRLQALGIIGSWNGFAWPTFESGTGPGQVRDNPKPEAGQAGQGVYKTPVPVPAGDDGKLNKKPIDFSRFERASEPVDFAADDDEDPAADIYLNGGQ